MSERLTATATPAFRLAQLARQEGRCALCGLHLSADEAVLDHDHTTGQVRGVLHRGCNAMLGHIENNRARNRLTSIIALTAFLRGVVPYVSLRRPEMPFYHTYRTVDEKRLLKNKRAAAARKARKT